MKAPDFLVIGAQKAGSTWIYDRLKEHPEVFMPKAVELMYFNKPDYADPKLREAYFENFNDADGFKRVGEKTPGYFWTTDRTRSTTQPPQNFNENIPASVKDVLGDKVDFIASLRHPVWRAISAFGHHAKRDRIAPNETLRDIAHSLGILDMGLYGAHLDAWIKAVGKERLEVLIFEDDIVGDPQAGFRKLCRFLKVDDTFVPAGLTKASNKGPNRNMGETGIAVGGRASQISPADVEFMLDAFADDIARTKNILGNDLASWDEETERLKEWCKKAKIAIKKNPTAVTKIHANPVVQRNREFQDHGLQAHQAVTRGFDRRFVFEPPARLSNMSMRGDCYIGAFSYAVSGYAFNTHIGRYCSLTRDVNIGQIERPMDWLSTNPFQYSAGFTFETGAKFEHKSDYDSVQLNPELAEQARLDQAQKTIIGNDVWIGHSAVIAGGVTIGDGAVIGANAVVTNDVAPYEIVEGVPAKSVGHRFTAAQRKRLFKVKWWQYATWQLAGVPFSDVDAALTEIEARVKAGMKPYAPGKVTNNNGGPMLTDVAD